MDYLLHDSTHAKAMFHIIKDVAKKAKYKKYVIFF